MLCTSFPSSFLHIVTVSLHLGIILHRSLPHILIILFTTVAVSPVPSPWRLDARMLDSTHPCACDDVLTTFRARDLAPNSGPKCFPAREAGAEAYDDVSVLVSPAASHA